MKNSAFNTAEYVFYSYFCHSTEYPQKLQLFEPCTQLNKTLVVKNCIHVLLFQIELSEINRTLNYRKAKMKTSERHKNLQKTDQKT